MRFEPKFISSSIVIVAALFILPVAQAGAIHLCKSNKTAYIDNGQVRLGVDLDSGGGIFYFSQKMPERNVLNHFDKGRFIQQSYYGDKDGSLWNKEAWRWNPVQGGGWKGEPAKVLASSIQAKKLYVKTRPKHWATGEDVNDALMEEWIDLNGKVAHIHFKFTYTGSKDNAKRDQELPAVFVDYSLCNLVLYTGARPWTNDILTRNVPGFPNEPAEADENWAAYVDDQDWGLGVYFPGTTKLTAYRSKQNGVAGPEGAACSYFAPIQELAITKGWTHQYDVYLFIGHVTEIRNTFKKLHVRDISLGRAL